MSKTPDNRNAGYGGERVRDDMRKSANHQPQQSQQSTGLGEQAGFGAWEETPRQQGGRDRYGLRQQR